MSDKKIKVPDEMLEAAMRECRKGTTVYHTCRSALEAALLWLSENPSQPDEEQMDELVSRYSWLDKDSVRFGAREWQRVMFLAPEAPTPLPIQNLLWGDFERNQGVPEEVNGILVIQSHNAQIEAAFKRGQQYAYSSTLP